MNYKIKKISTIIVSILLICQTNLTLIHNSDLLAVNTSVQAASKPKKIKLNKNKITLEVGKKQTLKATINPTSSKANIKWSSSNKKVAMVNSKGVVRGVKSGTAVITATTSNGRKSSCKVTVKQTNIEITSITIDQNDLTLNIDETYILTATISPSNAKNINLTWSSDNEEVVFVDSDGELYAVEEGTATITVISSNSKKASIKVIVIDSEDGIEDDTTEPTSEELMEPITEDPTEPISEDTTEPITEDPTEPITEDPTEPTTKTTTEPTTVKPTEAIEVQTIQISDSNKQCTVGDTFTLSLTISPTTAINKSITWSSNNTGVATVDNNGKVTAKSTGTVEITVKTNNGKTAKCTVNISAKPPTTIDVSSIQISNQEVQKKVDETIKLSATILPTNATNKTITWSSSNTAVAIVDNNGLVTAKSVGKADITVKSNNNKTAKCTITVSAKVDTPTRVFPTQGLYKITLAGTNNVLDVYCAGTTNGTKVTTYEWGGSKNQIWYLQHHNNKISFIVQCAPDKVLDIMRTNNSTNGELKAGCYTDIYIHNDCQAQDYYLEQFSDGTYIIRLASNNLVLQADSISKSAGVKLANYDVNNKLQRWNITGASLPQDMVNNFDVIWPTSNAYQITVLAYYYGSASQGVHSTKGGGTIKGAVDIGGTGDVVSIESGTVVEIVTGYGGGWGNNITIQHDNGNYSFYAHLKDNSITVTKNQRVLKGQKIGDIGNTGNSFGNHLHFEIWDKNKATTETWVYFRDKYKSKIKYDVDIVSGGSNPEAWKNWIVNNCKLSGGSYINK